MRSASADLTKIRNPSSKFYNIPYVKNVVVKSLDFSSVRLLGLSVTALSLLLRWVN